VIPLHTTTITVSRLNDEDTGYPDAEPTWQPVVSGVNAHFTLRQTGDEIMVAEQRSEANSILICDPCGLQQGDHVTDELSGAVWEVMWVIERTYPGGFEYTRSECAKRTAEMGALL
jgi:hypothetical protein